MSELWGIAFFSFHDGDVEEYKRLSAQAMEIVRTRDTGTLLYEIHLNADETEAVVLERFRDSEAFMEHGANLGDLTARILATGTVTGQVLGEPSAELRAMMPDGVVKLYAPWLKL